MLISSLYMKAIELHIKDAFPKSKVIVFCEESLFSPTKCAVKAYVDRYGAYICLDAFENVTEGYVSGILIGMIEDQMKVERSEDPSHPFADSVMMGERSGE